jgi:hypothetical protein
MPKFISELRAKFKFVFSYSQEKFSVTVNYESGY